MNSKLSDEQIIFGLAQALKGDAIKHVAPMDSELGEEYDYFDSVSSKLSGWNESQYRYALMFWDGWIDNSTHDWRYCTELSLDQWPAIAVEIADCLEKGISYPDELMKKMRYVWED